MILLIATIAITYCLNKIIASPIEKRSYKRAYSLCGILEAQGLVNKDILFSRLLIEKMLYLPIILILFLVSSSNHFIINPELFIKP